MKGLSYKAVLTALALALCSAGAWFLQRGGGGRSAEAHGAAPNPAAEMIVAGLGGFRGIASEIVWFRTDRLQDAGRYAELAQLATWLTYLDPYTPEVWAYASWNLAYNVSVMMPTAEDRWRWVEAGMKLLRDDGLRLNPSDPVLHKELAWLFLFKVGGRLDDAAPHYREAWARRVEECEKSGDWTALRMDYAGRAEVDGEYGRQDWRSPLASAIYWAHRGMRLASGPRHVASRLELRQILCQALVQEAEGDPSFAARAYRELLVAAKENPGVFRDEVLEAFRGRFNLPASAGK